MLKKKNFFHSLIFIIKFAAVHCRISIKIFARWIKLERWNSSSILVQLANYHQETFEFEFLRWYSQIEKQIDRDKTDKIPNNKWTHCLSYYNRKLDIEFNLVIIYIFFKINHFSRFHVTRKSTHHYYQSLFGSLVSFFFYHICQFFSLIK